MRRTPFLALSTLTILLLGLFSPPAQAASVPVYMTQQEIASLPVTGTAWANALKIASTDPGTPDIGNHDSYVQTKAFIAAVVYKRTGQGIGRDRIVAKLDQLARQTNVTAASPLSAYRQIGTWAATAALLDVPKDSTFGLWAVKQRSKVQAGSGGSASWNTIDGCSTVAPNNWGAYARLARASLDAYLGDTADLAKVAALHRRWVGDLTVPNTFKPTSAVKDGWIVSPPASTYVARQGVINPVTADARNGVNVEDAARGSSGPPMVGAGISYSAGALDGAFATAVVLYHNGYPDVFTWGNRGLGRNGRSLTDAMWGGLPGSYQHLPHLVNHVYGTALARRSAGVAVGRALGAGDWLAAPGSTWLR